MKIDKNIPVPGKRQKYPFSQMEIGDSFFAPRELAGAALSAAYSWRKHHPEFNYASRSEKGGIRVWRIEPDV